MALVKLLVDVPSELALGIGEVLIRLGAGGVEEQSDERGVRLIVFGEQEAELSSLAERARAALEELGVNVPGGSLAWRIEVDLHSDWDTAWTRYLVQQPLTPGWVIQPEWDSTPAPLGKGRILIRPMLAFGDGGHETTRLAAEAVERFCVAHPGASVVDFGTGTGVLAFIAALSGAHPVLGTDIDPVALSAAQQNAVLNGLEHQVAFQQVNFPLPSGVELVVANMEPRVLLEAGAEISACAREARELILTGFLSEQAAQIGSFFLDFGFIEFTRVNREDWCLLVLHPK